MISTSDHSDRITLVLLNAANRTIRSSIVEIPKSPWWEVVYINKVAVAHFGVAVRVVRCLFGDTNEVLSSKRIYAIEAIETPCQEGLITNLDSESRELIGDSLTALQEILGARCDPIHSRLIRCEPWIKQEFHNKMETFVGKAIADIKSQSIRWTQLRCWPRGYVYAIEAKGTHYIFKACPPAYAIEPMLTNYLSKKYPHLIAEVQAIEVNEFFLLSAAFNGQEVAIGDNKSLEAAVYGLAKIQIAEVNQVSKLISFGLIFQDYPILKESISALINDPSALMVGKEGGLTHQELNKFKGMQKLLTLALTRLQAIGIPLTLEHGDFRAANILCNDRHACCIIDWSEAAISHPFFSLAQLLDEETYAQDRCAADQVKDQIALAYFSPWLEAGFTKAYLKEALDLARLLMPLVKAIERRERLIPNLADAKSWRFSVTYWIRRFFLRLNFHPTVS